MPNRYDYLERSDEIRNLVYATDGEAEPGYDSDADVFSEEDEADLDAIDMEGDDETVNDDSSGTIHSESEPMDLDRPQDRPIPTPNGGNAGPIFPPRPVQNVRTPQQNVSTTPTNNKCSTCKWEHDNNFTATDFVFDSSNSGVQLDYDQNNCKEIDIFHQMFEYDLMGHIAQETNKYAQTLLRDELTEFSKLKRWTDTDPDELYCFFATLLLMSHTKKNFMKQYWSTDPLIETPIFSKIFSQDRFFLLLRVLHFDDNSLANGGDKLYKIRTIIETLRHKFSSCLQPSQNLVIDESLMLWKGRLAFRQYNPRKRNRFGIKLFVLCDCSTGIILDFIVYTGKSTNYEGSSPDAGVSAKVIQSLMQPYLGKNHVVYMDNWYSSPSLFDWLYTENTGACGTVRVDRAGLPCLPKKMKKGEVVVRHTATMIAVRWRDRRCVTMLSTAQNHEMVSIQRQGNEVKKPKAVVEYNKHMGAIDKSDMVMSFNDTTRKTNKWYKKLVLHLVDMTAVNCHQI